jgi:hypothetical protein
MNLSILEVSGSLSKLERAKGNVPGMEHPLDGYLSLRYGQVFTRLKSAKRYLYFPPLNAFLSKAPSRNLKK